MNKAKLSILLILPLLLGFYSDTDPSDAVQLAPFEFKPLIYKEENKLTFSFLTFARTSLPVSVWLLLSNRTFSNQTVDQRSFSLIRGRSVKVEMKIPPFYLTSGLNEFKLIYSYESMTKTITYRLGSYGGEALILPTSVKLKDMYLGVSYANGVFTYDYYVLNYEKFNSIIEISNDLRLPLEIFNSPFTKDSEALVERVSLVFVNKNFLFPRLAKTTDGHPYIDLTLMYNESIISYCLSNQIYVDDVTHIISPIKDVGFRLTKEIYFPKNRIGDLEYGYYELRLEGFSSLKIEIIYRFALAITRPYLASNGQYDIDFRWG